MDESGSPGFIRGIKGSLIAAAVLLAWDGALHATFLMSLIFCPIWLLASLVRNAITRPGWGLALARAGIPALTLGLAWANHRVQLEVAEANAQRVVAACEAYRADNSKFPEELEELVPRYLDFVPRAKYCLGPPSCFYYLKAENPMLFWQVVPPHYRKNYHFDSRSWSYLD